MSNSYFQFKQFRVEQGSAAMKVSTDACIQGAWTPINGGVQQVLDIGCGTGLLSLMLAQRSNEKVLIDAVELDAAAVEQAKANIAASPWKQRITVHQADIHEFKPAHKYGLIICNPPFFTNSLLGDELARNQARHTLTLTYKGLVKELNRLLSDEGYASVLMPFTEIADWRKLIEDEGLYLQQVLIIQPRTDLEPNRVIVLCGRKLIDIQQQTLVIYQKPGEYTEEFKALLQPYYLYL